MKIAKFRADSLTEWFIVPGILLTFFFLFFNRCDIPAYSCPDISHHRRHFGLLYGFGANPWACNSAIHWGWKLFYPSIYHPMFAGYSHVLSTEKGHFPLLKTFRCPYYIIAIFPESWDLVFRGSTGVLISHTSLSYLPFWEFQISDNHWVLRFPRVDTVYRDFLSFCISMVNPYLYDFLIFLDWGLLDEIAS